MDSYCVKISGLHTKLADVHQRYDNAKQVCSKWEALHQRATLEAMDRVRVTASVKDSCWQIYSDICLRKGIQPVHKDDYAKQLDVIKKHLLLLRKVNEAVESLEKDRQKLSLVACVSETEVS